MFIRGFVFMLFIFSSTHVSGVLRRLQKVKVFFVIYEVMTCVLSDLWSDDCFDKDVILFNSRICVCELSVPLKMFVSDGVFLSFFVFSLLSEFNVFMCLCQPFCLRMCIYFQFFFVFLSWLFHPQIIYELICQKFISSLFLSFSMSFYLSFFLSLYLNIYISIYIYI